MHVSSNKSKNTYKIQVQANRNIHPATQKIILKDYLVNLINPKYHLLSLKLITKSMDNITNSN